MNDDVQLCDVNHQPIAFLGTCPICRTRARQTTGGAPLDLNKTSYAGDLAKALRRYFQREAAQV